jgi:hypothetical protein
MTNIISVLARSTGRKRARRLAAAGFAARRGWPGSVAVLVGALRFDRTGVFERIAFFSSSLKVHSERPQTVSDTDLQSNRGAGCDHRPCAATRVQRMGWRRLMSR